MLSRVPSGRQRRSVRPGSRVIRQWWSWTSWWWRPQIGTRTSRSGGGGDIGGWSSPAGASTEVASRTVPAAASCCARLANAASNQSRLARPRPARSPAHLRVNGLNPWTPTARNAALSSLSAASTRASTSPGAPGRADPLLVVLFETVGGLAIVAGHPAPPRQGLTSELKRSIRPITRSPDKLTQGV